MAIVSDDRWHDMFRSRGDNDLERSKKVRDKYKHIQQKKASEEAKNEVYRERLIEAVTSGVMEPEQAKVLAAQKGLQNFRL